MMFIAAHTASEYTGRLFIAISGDVEDCKRSNRFLVMVAERSTGRQVSSQLGWDSSPRCSEDMEVSILPF